MATKMNDSMLKDLIRLNHDYRKSYEQHEKLEEELRKLNSQKGLSLKDELERKRIQKEKLSVKDQMEKILLDRSR